MHCISFVGAAAVAIVAWVWAPIVFAADLPGPASLPLQIELPDPLACLDGSKVANRQDWEQARRPELRRLFQHYMYGRIPARPLSMQSEVVHTAPDFLGGKATLEEITLTFFMQPDKPLKHRLHLLLVTPNRRAGPAPVFVAMNFCGNHTVVDDPQIRIPDAWVYAACPGVKNELATAAGRGGQKDVWNVDLIIDRGYALATFYSGDIDPDTADFADGLNAELLDLSRPLAGDDSGAIACWAWGYHRVADYIETDNGLDARRIAAVGHSRNGKTTLLAAATDERFALAIPHQAGCGGTAPSRGKVGESVKQINDRFPHWFCDRFTEFNEQPERLPIDQHCLVALCAPRPVLFTNAQEDQWANPSGQFDVLRAAAPVYKLLGVGALETEKEPPQGQLSNGRLGYFIRAGKHSMTREDWQVFLTYADKWLGDRDGKEESNSLD